MKMTLIQDKEKLIIAIKHGLSSSWRRRRPPFSMATVMTATTNVTREIIGKHLKNTPKIFRRKLDLADDTNYDRHRANCQPPTPTTTAL